MYSIMQPPVSSHNSIFIPERIAREASQQAAKDLGLSEAQKEEYYQLQLRAMEQMESLSKPGKKPTPEESKAHAEAIEAQRLSFGGVERDPHRLAI